MENIRYYGLPPYNVVLVHGGPGAAGEMAPVARKLSARFGILEPFQTKYSVSGQVEELYAVIRDHSISPVVLVGFSWGAWLAILVAAKYYREVSKLILIGCGPLEDQYVQDIFKTRMSRLDSNDQNKLNSILSGIEKRAINNIEDAFSELGSIMTKADSYDPISEREDIIYTNAEIYFAVWKEASELRSSGSLLTTIDQIRCPVEIIHGDYDPHPSSAVIQPLSSKLQRKLRCHILPDCGHKPWIERSARKSFYRILEEGIHSGLLS